jgi:hypothetical protein
MTTTINAIRRHAHRQHVRLGFLLVAAIVLSGRSDDRAVQAQSPPCDIVCENAKTAGVTPQSQWDIVGNGDEEIQGFAVDLSVNRGQTVQFKIDSETAYDIEIYRLGYYGGNGARKVGEILDLSGDVIQPSCDHDTATGLVDCGDWSVTASWQTDVNIPSGIFIAKLIRDGGGASHIPFIVRDDNYAADLLFQTSDTTWQAYNRWGDGSLYCDGPVSNAGTVYANAECPGRAVKVSYNRPFDTRGHDATSFLFNAEYPMLRWLEKNGYAVKYWTGIDTDRIGADSAIGLTSPKKPKIFLSVGHDEYWSGPQRTNVEAARAAGVNLAFFSGNEMFWRTRWENSIDATPTPYKTLVGWKESLTGTEIDGSTSLYTGTWRDTRFTPNPENALTGQLWAVNSGTAAITVTEPIGKLRLWRGTNVATLAPGASATLGTDTLGYEWDEDTANGVRPAGLMRLSATTVADVERVLDLNGVVVGPGPATHNLTMYRHASGAYVFGAGTVQWSWGLDGNHDRGTPASHPPDARMEQATVNLFADMSNVQPGTLAAHLTAASPSLDSTPPDSLITLPATGSLAAMNSPVFIKGTATDVGGAVAAIEVSTDGGSTWNRATGLGSWMYRWIPTVSGPQTVLSRAVDDTGNVETTTPSIQVTVTSPSQAPGGPVLVVTSESNPFTNYYTEILRTEGFNIFNTADISTVSAGTLGSYDVVILGEMALSAGQVTMFSDWVTGGGNLIAMRPDKQLYGLLGLTDAASTLSNAYLLFSSQTVATTGLVSETIQFHGTADLATLNGASLVARLYSDATTSTVYPAVTLRAVGALGGQASAFLYDLAKSVVYTRQGNPAWSGQNRDLIDPIRSDDLFFGNYVFDPQPDWVNLNKVAIPQADEQQRLFANAILYVMQDRKPLPRFWYFPRDEKAVVVMTGDAHGHSTSTARLNELNASSSPTCSLSDWECLRGTAYIYPNTPTLFDGGALGVAEYVGQGHEIALHPNTGCLDYTPTSLNNFFTAQLEDLALRYPSAPPVRTNRTHCIVWSDYSSGAEVELQNGIRYDTTYYYWPGTWVQNRPGFMGGSGMPMRFAKSTGEIIDVYQDVTEMIDEDNSSHTFPFFANTLLDKAIGAEGYYGVFTGNMHGDGGQDSDVKQAAIVTSALARGVPVVSAAQMLDWLDGRNNSSFGSLTWDGSILSFTVTQAPGANGLRGMLPAFTAGSLDSITRNGTPITYSLSTIKGVTYAIFDATTGGYQATYLPDLSPPIISGVSATPLTASSALVAWTTDEAASTRVIYGTSAASLNQDSNDPALNAVHAMTLTSLNPNTTYHYRVISVDFFGNSATFPEAPAAPLTFATPPLLQSFTDTTAGDFNGGTVGTETMVAQTDDGEVILKPTGGSEFFGTSLPAGWTSGTYDPSGSVTVNNGQLVLNNGWARTSTNYGPGRSLEFVATFGPDTFQHSGFGQTFDCGQPWAIFSTSNSTTELWARTTAAGCNQAGPDTNFLIPGNWLGAPHRFRIDWNLTDVAYFIDGVEVARHNVQITPMMQMLAASDFDEGTNAGQLVLDWERMSPYPSPGAFHSRVFDAGSSVSWYNVAWTAGLPAGSGVALAVRVGGTPTPDGSWTSFITIPGNGGLITGAPARQYLQYRATLTTTDNYFSPEVRSVTVNHAVGSANTAPTATDDTGSVNEDIALTFPVSGTGSLTANDTDAETPTQLTVIDVANATNGAVVINLDGSVTFTPTANFSGVGTFTYTVSDGALTDDGLVTVTVNPVNDPPVGVADPSAVPGSYYGAVEDTVLNVPVATGVLANDTDVDNAHGTLTAHIHTLPAHGAVTLSLDGSFIYTPAADYAGPDGFFYRVSDGTAQSDPIGASIMVAGVNDPPVAFNDAYDVSRSGIPVAVTSLVRSGSTATGTTALQHGFTTGHSVLIAGATESEYNGTVVVTATGPNTFTYTVAGTPASPATGAIFATAQSTTRTIAAPGVISNDRDVEGTAMTATLGTTTSNGTLVFNADGSFTYTPGALFVGVDSFTYSVTDAFSGTSNVATVTITVHNEIATLTAGESGGTVATGVGATAADPIETSVTTPIAGEVRITEGPISGLNAAAGYSFLGQEVGITVSTITNENPLTDPNNPLILTFTVDTSLVAVGQTVLTLQVFRNGVLIPNCPPDPLTAGNLPCVSNRTTLGDGDLQFSIKTLAPSQWNVAALIAGDTNASTPEDTALNGNVSTLSGHPNPASLTFAKEIDPTHGIVAVNADGTFTYTPASNYNGSDSFTYSANDGFGGIGYGTVSITVTAVNDAPGFTAGANQSVQKNSGLKTVADWATSISAGPANESSQTVSFNVSSNNPSLFSTGPAVASNGTLTFTPATGQAGIATVTVTAVDNGGVAGGGVDTSAPQQFTITVVDPFPIAICQNVTVAAPLTGHALASINNGSNDPDGGAVTLAQVPPGPYTGGVTSVQLQVTDSGNQVATCSANVTVTAFAQGASFGFEEASGGTSVDSSGNANNGTFNTTTGPTRVTTGRFGKAMQFDGVNDLISVADANSLDFTSAMTLMAWVKVSTTTGWRNMIMKQAGSDLVYGVYANDTASGSGRAAGYIKSGGATRSVRANEAPAANKWMHVAVTFASATNQMRIFIDGTLHRTLTTSGTMSASTGVLTIGGNNVWLDEFFSGTMDEVRVMNVALAETDIRTLMTTPVVPGSAAPATDTTGLVAAYNFNDGTATDNTGLGHNGVLTGTTTAAGKFGNALSFNGTSDRIAIADANDLDFTTGMTLEAYVKPSTVTDWRTVMLKQTTDGLAYALYVSDQAQHAAGFIRISAIDRDVREDNPLPLNTWSHVVVTYDKAGSRLQLWVDGIKKDERVITGDITTSTGSLYIGGNTFWGEYFGGQIDNIRLYNRPLNTVEIQTNQVTAVQ